MKDYRVMMDVAIRPEDFRELMCVDLADRLSEDARALSPVTTESEKRRTVGATFGVWAYDALDAMVQGRAIMLEALEQIGVRPPMEVVYVEVVPYDRTDEVDFPGKAQAEQAAALDPA